MKDEENDTWLVYVHLVCDSSRCYGILAASHPTSNYSTPPGAFLCTIDQNGMSYPLIGSVAFFALGLVHLTQGYREKDQ